MYTIAPAARQHTSPSSSRTPLRTKLANTAATAAHCSCGGGCPRCAKGQSIGQALPTSVRNYFEPRLNADLSDVRVHTDPTAAQAVNARAYTIGSNITFNADEYAPHSTTGKHLLAHELTHVVQQRQAGTTARQHFVSAATDAAEREAAHAADVLVRGGSFTPQATPSSAISRSATEGSHAASGEQPLIAGRGPTPVTTPPPTGGTAPTTTTHDASVASVSWIDASSPAGGFVSDPAPPTTITESFITGSNFRFSNYLHAWVETTDAVHVGTSGFHANSGIYRGASFAGIPSWTYPTAQSSARVTVGGIETVEFEQTVGARTISPGVIGGAVGGGVGAGVGAWGGAKIGAAIGALGGPIGALGGALIGAGLGAGIGYLAGTAIASRATNFPPIWTRLKLSLSANGNRNCSVLAHSHFPSSNYYCDLVQWSAYSALAPEQTAWESGGWDTGNPWGIGRPLFTP